MGAQAVRLSNIDIDNALENRDFEVMFQPIFDLGNGALARMETFVRWRHPKLGVLPPGAFISFFETQGRMGELTRYVLEEALDHYIKWRGNCAPGFSINLAATDLADNDFPAFVTALLRDRDFPVDAVTFECPMPALTSDTKEIMDQLAGLKTTGVRLAIEVRGRANDFIRDASPFPFEEIKTGGAAILRFARTVRGPGLSAISELLDIASNAGASITAVGVEDQASLAALRGLGFSAAQGNHLGKVGGLGDFRPAQVNTVRELLDLETLSATELSDLFRTERPQIAKEVTASPADDHDGDEKTAEPAPKATRKRRTRKTAANKATAQAADLPREKAKSGEAPTNNKSVTQDDAPKASETIDAKSSPDEQPAGEATQVPDASNQVVERARRKAALLARKKGKDALRVELAARRKKLGLSDPVPTLQHSGSAARTLQDKLSDAFPAEQSGKATTDAPDANLDANPDANEGVSDDQAALNMPDELVSDDQLPDDQLSEELVTDTPEASENVALTQMPTSDEAPALANSDDIQTSDIQADEEQAAPQTLTLITLDDLAPAPPHKPETQHPSETAEVKDIAESRQDLPAPAEPSTIDNNSEASTDGAISRQPTDTHEGKLVFVPASKAAMIAEDHGAPNADKPADTGIAAQASPVEGLAVGTVITSSGRTSVEAYFLETLHVYTQTEDATPQNYEPEESVTSTANLQHADNLVLVSMDEDAAASNSGQLVTNQSEPVPDLSHQDELPEAPLFASSSPVTDDSIMPTKPATVPANPQIETDGISHTDHMGDLETADADGGLAGTGDVERVYDDTGLLNPEDREAAHLDESLIVAKTLRRTQRRKKNILMRKYPLWPDHFWPRSWRRAWDRRAANRDFVRRAKAAAARLGSIDDEDDIELI